MVVDNDEDEEAFVKAQKGNGPEGERGLEAGGVLETEDVLLNISELDRVLHLRDA